MIPMRAVRAGRGPSREERGSVSVAAVGVMVVTIILALGSADVARALAAVSRAQTAADAAALAAVQEMASPSGSETPEQAASDYASRNGGALASCSCEPDQQEAVVSVHLAVGGFLLFGGDRVVTARARAVVDPR